MLKNPATIPRLQARAVTEAQAQPARRAKLCTFKIQNQKSKIQSFLTRERGESTMGTPAALMRERMVLRRY